jgi:hypothetical protein
MIPFSSHRRIALRRQGSSTSFFAPLFRKISVCFHAQIPPESKAVYALRIVFRESRSICKSAHSSALCFFALAFPMRIAMNLRDSHRKLEVKAQKSIFADSSFAG